MTEEIKTILIEFNSMEDFTDRIVNLWQDLKDDEVYNFIFPNIGTELAWIMMAKRLGI